MGKLVKGQAAKDVGASDPLGSRISDALHANYDANSRLQSAVDELRKKIHPVIGPMVEDTDKSLVGRPIESPLCDDLLNNAARINSIALEIEKLVDACQL